jgi:hypothetical protein
MKILLFTCACMLAISGSVYCYDSSSSDVKIPEGMVVERVVDGVNVVVPEGGKVRREDGRIYLESSDEYAARLFRSVDERLSSLEYEIMDLKRQVDGLRGNANRSSNDNNMQEPGS